MVPISRNPRSHKALSPLIQRICWVLQCYLGSPGTGGFLEHLMLCHRLLFILGCIPAPSSTNDLRLTQLGLSGHVSH